MFNCFLIDFCRVSAKLFAIFHDNVQLFLISLYFSRTFCKSIYYVLIFKRCSATMFKMLHDNAQVLIKLSANLLQLCLKYLIVFSNFNCLLVLSLKHSAKSNPMFANAVQLSSTLHDFLMIFEKSIYNHE